MVVHPFMNSRSISTYSNLQFSLISKKEYGLAHSCACGGRLQHLHCTPQCASLAERFIYQENTFLIYKKRDTNKCISLKYCFIHSYVGIIQIRLWVEVLNFLSAWYTSSPCFLHMISIKSCLIDVNRFFLHLIQDLFRYCSHNVRPATHLAILNRLWRWGEMHSSQNMHPPCQSAE